MAQKGGKSHAGSSLMEEPDNSDQWSMASAVAGRRSSADEAFQLVLGPGDRLLDRLAGHQPRHHARDAGSGSRSAPRSPAAPKSRGCNIPRRATAGPDSCRSCPSAARRRPRSSCRTSTGTAGCRSRRPARQAARPVRAATDTRSAPWPRSCSGRTTRCPRNTADAAPGGPSVPADWGRSSNPPPPRAHRAWPPPRPRAGSRYRRALPEISARLFEASSQLTASGGMNLHHLLRSIPSPPSRCRTRR